MTMKIYQKSSNVILLETTLNGCLDPGVEDVIDLLSFLTSPLDRGLGDMSVALHLAPVNVTLDHVRLETIFTQEFMNLSGDHISASITSVGE